MVKRAFVLASRSPRRLELLRLVVPSDAIVVMPPRDANEAGFDGLHDLAAIERRLGEIARAKAADVAAQLLSPTAAARITGNPVIIAADTAIVGTGAAGGLHVLAHPPEDETFRQTVRQWFREYYAGRAHLALTALCVHEPQGASVERIVQSEVTFIPDVERHLEWYIGTGEPPGKAGGYAIQGAGSIFVSKLSGSLTNVVGLPLEALLEAFSGLSIDFEK